MIDLLISILEINHPDEYFKSTDKGDINMRVVPTKKITSWLKYLKERVQPKQEWSEEDEKIKHELEVILANTSLFSKFKLNYTFFDIISWLKSLKERYTWKPSESDILLLERIANGKSNPQDFQASLGVLIGQLKKLREK